jgi:hypothetical protein
MPEPQYARIAYEAYVAFHARVGTRVVPAAWQDVPFDEQQAWEAAIDAAFNAQIPGDAP